MSLAGIFETELQEILSLGQQIERSPCTEIESASAELYETYGFARPAVVYCPSPYQLVVLPSLLIGMFFSDAWQVVSLALAGRDSTQGTWQQDFEEGFSALWSHGGQQLFAGMKASSRISSQYFELEAGIYLQAKNELKEWINSLKLPCFERILPKEIVYRQFWAMHLWHLNPFCESLRKLKAEIEEKFFEEALSFPVQWQQFSPYQERHKRVLSNASAAFSAMISRMGAEPSSQMKHCNWFPASVAELSLASVWQKHVNPASFAAKNNEISAWLKFADKCFAAICLEHVVFVCPKPISFLTDEAGRLHNPDGPSISFTDGFAEYNWHGVFVEKQVIENPESIKCSEIDSTTNAELKRVLIERYGQARYLLDTGAEELARDKYGILYKKAISGDEDLVMVKVLNSTAEPDGSFREYFLRVPPQMRSPKEAIAWTFAFDEEDYMPLRES